jgi:hypothetical protein
MSDREEMIWTTELPTRPGFYWVRHGGAEDAIPYVRDCRERLPRAGEQGAHTVWAGPIPEPSPPPANRGER